VSDTHEYRCLACMEATVTRDFDVSHLSRTCDDCGEFGRFVNTIVLDQYDALEADPPEDLHWDRLDRPQRFMIAERLTRHGYTIDDFDIEINDADEGDADSDDGGTGTDDEIDDTDDGDADTDDETDDTDDGATGAASPEADSSDGDAGD
jgi:hypothetical protein